MTDEEITALRAENTRLQSHIYEIMATIGDIEPQDIIPYIRGLHKSLSDLAGAKALAGVRGLVAGWNGENLPPDKKGYERHPSRLGARIETNCGQIYALDEALTAAKKALGPPDQTDREAYGETVAGIIEMGTPAPVWSDWIPWDGNGHNNGPVPWAKPYEWGARFSDGSGADVADLEPSEYNWNRDASGDCVPVKYRYRMDLAPKVFKPKGAIE